MADSALSCSSHCLTSDALCSDVVCATDAVESSTQRGALLDIVASANHLSGSSMLSVSPAGPDRNFPQLHLHLARSTADVSPSAGCVSPLETSNLALVQRGPSWQEMWRSLQKDDEQQDSQSLRSKTAAARRCLCLEVASSARDTAIHDVQMPPRPATGLPCTPAAAGPAVDAGSCSQSSSESRRRIQQWLSSMELKLQIPISPVLPPTEPCPAPTGAAGKTKKRSSSATAAALLTDFERSSKRMSSTVSAEQEQESTPAAAGPSAHNAAEPSAAAVSNAAAGNGQGAVAATPLQIRMPYEDAAAAPAEEEAVPWTPGTIPPPAFVILGVLSRNSKP